MVIAPARLLYRQERSAETNAKRRINSSIQMPKFRIGLGKAWKDESQKSTGEQDARRQLTNALTCRLKRAGTTRQGERRCGEGQRASDRKTRRRWWELLGFTGENLAPQSNRIFPGPVATNAPVGVNSGYTYTQQGHAGQGREKRRGASICTFHVSTSGGVGHPESAPSRHCAA